MPSNKKLLQAAAGNAGESLYVEDVFSTYVYDSTHGTSPIVNNINLADEGGMVWFKHRTSTYSNILFDTERGTSNHLVSNTTAANATSIGLSSFNTDGFSFSGVNLNVNSDSHVAWTFRKAEKFFDVVTYTGNGTAGRTVSHNLGSVPAVIVVKSTTNGAYNWMVYHQSLGNTNYLRLNETTQTLATAGAWNNTTPTDSEFTLGGASVTNGNGESFVAYLFASDAGGFGNDGTENIIKCGSYTGNGSADGPTINCGFEPQWLLIKNTSDGGNWVLMDAMRGMPVGDEATALVPNANSAESSYANLWGVDLQATGFKVNVSQIQINESGGTMIYIAIRRPMKTPASGTEVFYVDTVAASSSSSTGFDPDLWIRGSRDGSAGTNSQINMARLIDGKYLLTTQTSSESGTNAPFGEGPSNQFTNTVQGGSGVNWFWRRAPNYFDVVAYTGTNGTISRNHNLTVAPELMIFKRRDGTGAWTVLSELDGSSYSEMALNSTIDKSTRNYSANQYLTAQPTATVFAQAAGYDNVSGADYITYLFATLAGVSKVGSVAHSGTTNVDCGFSAGARFVLVKRTDSTGDWYVWDSVRGIVAGNDPYLLLNSTAAEITYTDYIDPLSSGFTLTSSFTAGTYLFLAIA